MQPGGAGQGGPADLVLRGGAVYTVDASRPWAEAVAIRGGRIVAVGADGDVRGLVGRGSEVVDLRGRMVLPGFQDAHVHPVGGGLNRLRCDLSDLHSREGYLRRIREYAGEHPDAWILGGGWAMDVFPGGTPARDDLDAVVPDRPVFLPNRDGHSAWVNSKALELAGITRDAPDPPDGRIERDARGEPRGTLHEGAMGLVERLIPPPTPAELVKALVAAQQYLHSLGITAWQDAIVGRYATLPDAYDAYLELAEEGRLTARVVGALWWERDRGEEQVEGLLERRARATAGRFRASTVKIMQDGVCENFTAAMLQPYLGRDGRPTGNRGISFVDPEALGHHVTRLDREGFQVHFHAIGDRAVREALDAVEAARRANGMNDHRHHIAHLQVVHPDDLPRFRTLGVVANAQPLWAVLDAQMTELTLPFLGPERSAWQYPFASLFRAGATLAFGSDWPVSSPNPLEELHVAVNRALPGRPETAAEPFLPHEGLDLPVAIAAFTMGSAYVNHLEGQTGSVEVGKLADLVVLDRNLFEAGPEAIASARVLLTLVEGRPVFEDPSL